jgi:hypothetical protein
LPCFIFPAALLWLLLWLLLSLLLRSPHGMLLAMHSVL